MYYHSTRPRKQENNWKNLIYSSRTVSPSLQMLMVFILYFEFVTGHIVSYVQSVGITVFLCNVCKDISLCVVYLNYKQSNDCTRFTKYFEK